MATKKNSQNRYKTRIKKRRRPKPEFFVRGKAPWGRVSLALFIGTMSLGCIYMHDAILQSPLFDVKTITIDGLDRVTRAEVLTRTGLDRPTHIFNLQSDLLEKKLNTHPWIRVATVKRHLLSTISIRIEEQEPLAIVAIDNLAEIVINTQGAPFKTYDPARDNLTTLPVISGVDLSLSGNSTYLFEGELFNAVMDILKIKGVGQIKTILGDEDTGILINLLTNPDRGGTQNPGETASENQTVLPIKLGFDRFEKKLARVRQIQRYMARNHPGTIISAIDAFNLGKVFVTTEDAASIL